MRISGRSAKPCLLSAGPTRALRLVVLPSGKHGGERKRSLRLRPLRAFPARVDPGEGGRDNDMALVFPGGGRSVGLRGNEGDGGRVTTYKVTRPMLAVSGGTLGLRSTPYGRRGFLCEAGARLAAARSAGAGERVSAGECASGAISESPTIRSKRRSALPRLGRAYGQVTVLLPSPDRSRLLVPNPCRLPPTPFRRR